MAVVNQLIGEYMYVFWSVCILLNPCELEKYKEIVSSAHYSCLDFLSVYLESIKMMYS